MSMGYSEQWTGASLKWAESLLLPEPETVMSEIGGSRFEVWVRDVINKVTYTPFNDSRLDHSNDIEASLSDTNSAEGVTVDLINAI